MSHDTNGFPGWDSQPDNSYTIYGQAGQPPAPPPFQRPVINRRPWILGASVALALLLLAIIYVIATSSPEHHKAAAISIQTATPSPFPATYTPNPNPTPMPTSAITGQPLPTPTAGIVYVNQKGTPYPTYTPRPPYPTYTPPPGATATPTPRPTSTVDDPYGQQATQAGGSWYVTQILAGSLTVTDRNDHTQAAALIWHDTSIQHIEANIYFCTYATPSGDDPTANCGVFQPGQPDPDFACSPDGNTWQPCAITSRVGTQANKWWIQVKYQLTAPAGTNYVMIQLGQTDPKEAGPDVSDVIITYQP